MSSVLPSSSESGDANEKLGDLAAAAGLKRIHLLAWRDLADVEAGGSEVHAAKIAKLWAEAGIEVTMRTSYAQGSPPEAMRDGYRVIRKAGRYLVFPRAALSEATGRHGKRDGLVEIWNGVPFFSPLWARGPRMTFLHHVHEEMWPMVLPPRLARAGQILERWIAPPAYRTTPIVTLSQSSKQKLVDRLRLKPQQIHVVPPGIDARFNPGGARSETPLVVAVGRLMPSKRFDALIRDLHDLRTEIDLKLVIVGEGYELDNLRNLISELGAGEWCELAGRVDDQRLVDLYRSAWVVTSASASEGWGMTLTEAAACGTPAVATDIAGHRDAVVHAKSGLLVADNELAAAIGRVITDRELARELAAGALERARELTWERTAHDTLAVLAAEAQKRHA